MPILLIRIIFIIWNKGSIASSRSKILLKSSIRFRVEISYQQ